MTFELMAEFDCAECGNCVVSFEPAAYLCALCIHLPGWWQVARLRQIFQYEGDAHWTMGDEYERSG